PVSGGAETIRPTNGASAYLQKLSRPEYQTNRMPDTGLEYVELTICGPLKNDMGGKDEVDFDDPAFAARSQWQQSEATKLRVQVTFNYRMPIPFANWVIHKISLNQELPWVIALNSKNK